MAQEVCSTEIIYKFSAELPVINLVLKVTWLTAV